MSPYLILAPFFKIIQMKVAKSSLRENKRILGNMQEDAAAIDLLFD